MTTSDQLTYTGLGAGNGGLIFGLSTGQIQGLLGMTLALLMILATIWYVIYRFRLAKKVTKEMEAGKAEHFAALEVAKADLATAKAELAAAQAKEAAAREEAEMYRKLNERPDDE